jgi:hypothetical protein
MVPSLRPLSRLMNLSDISFSGQFWQLQNTLHNTGGGAGYRLADFPRMKCKPAATACFFISHPLPYLFFNSATSCSCVISLRLALLAGSLL